jgi:hypothetical protein
MLVGNMIWGGPNASEGPWILFMVLTALWAVPWKGVALWKAARQDSKVWFIVLLLVNTLAVLEILYIFIFSKKKGAQTDVAVEGPEVGQSN